MFGPILSIWNLLIIQHLIDTVFILLVYGTVLNIFFLKKPSGRASPRPPPLPTECICLFIWFSFFQHIFSSLLEVRYTRMVHLPESPFTEQFFQMTTYCFGVHGYLVNKAMLETLYLYRTYCCSGPSTVALKAKGHHIVLHYFIFR